MKKVIITSGILAVAGIALLSSAQAFNGGNSGGDREPAGGAFMSSYTDPGSTGIQAGGPPRSVDIPRGYGNAPGYGWNDRGYRGYQDQRFYR